MRRALVLAVACQVHEDPPPPPAPPPAPHTSAGVPAGGIVRDASEGPSAVIAASDGDVTVRRVGELAYTPATAREPLWGGDEVRTGEHASATLLLADRSVIELAEDSALAIANRHTQPLPASAVAVLFGVARFTVTPRAPGEDWFLVLVPTGLVEIGRAEYDKLPVTTVVGVGVAIDGRARVVTEAGAHASGIGEWTKADGVPEHAIDDSDGPIDWGAWRAGADAGTELAAALADHRKHLLRLEDNLALAYEDLVRIAEQCARYERKIAVAQPVGEDPNLSLPDPQQGAWLGAAYATATRIQVLTWQFAGRAALVNEIVARRPELAGERAELAARGDAAIVWPKRFEATAIAFLAPLRLVYAAIAEEGRRNAAALGIVVPAKLANVHPSYVDPDAVRERTETPIWYMDTPDAIEQPRPVWALDPPTGWDRGLAATPSKRAMPWYVRHDHLAPPVIVGVPASAPIASKLAVQPAQTRDQLRSLWQIPINEALQVHAPDLALEQRTRAKLKLEDNKIPRF